MITKELLDYIRSESARGAQKDAIAQTLVGNGWLMQDVNDAFSSLAESPKLVLPSIPSAASPTAPTAQSSGFGEKAAKIEMAYDSVVKKVSELGGQQRQVVTDSIKKLEQRKMAEIKKRLAI